MPFQGARGEKRVIAHEFEHALRDQHCPKSPKLGGLDGEAEIGLSAALVASVRFPYTAGADFVSALQRRGGWTLVDHAFADPPTTSEQILHPGQWISGEDGVDVSVSDASVLGPGWSEIASVESGELDALVILATGVPAEVAERAAYQLAGTEDCGGICRTRRAAVVNYLWEAEDDAADFAVAARR